MKLKWSTISRWMIIGMAGSGAIGLALWKLKDYLYDRKPINLETIYEYMKENNKTFKKDFMTILDASMNEQSLDLFKRILSEHPKLILERDKYGNTLLHRVIYDMDLSLTKYLLPFYKSTGNLDIRNNAGFTPLHCATLSVFHKAVRLLIDQGANVNVEAYFTEYSPLKFAIISEDVAMVKTLLEASADFQCRHGNHRPFLLAVYTGNTKLVNILLEQPDLDLNFSNYSRSPLNYAILHKHYSIVESILKHGADVNAIYTHTPETPLETASKIDASPILSLLLSHGANQIVQPMHQALHYDQYQNFRILLNHFPSGIHGLSNTHGSLLHSLMEERDI
mmetsp:Transcript_12573/g.18849  ORF Transcript_12573/g.18849 Transcript_12573/m.18849 type:complete len:337 (+) Transcript_12573:119-1129(+)